MPTLVVLTDLKSMYSTHRGTNPSDVEDLERLQTRTKQLLLLARIRERSGNVASSLATLKEARDNQYRVQQRTSLEIDNNDTTTDGTNVAREQHKIMARICLMMAEHANHLHDHRQAIEHCKQALQFARDDLATLTLLARLYVQVGCQSDAIEGSLIVATSDSDRR